MLSNKLFHFNAATNGLNSAQPLSASAQIGLCYKRNVHAAAGRWMRQ